MIDNDYGHTLISELAVNPKSRHVKRFLPPEPVREVSIAVHNSFVKEMLLARMREAILKSMLTHFRKIEKFMRIRWN